MCADTLVSVYKRVIFYKPVTEPSSLLLDRWVQLSIPEALKRGIERRLLKALVTDSPCPAGLFNKLVMQHQDLPLA